MQFNVRIQIYPFVGIAAAGVLLAGCKGIAPQSERQARQDLGAVRDVYRPPDRPRPLPALTTNSPMADFLRFAMLNQPRVEAAYFEWAASVERITRERSLPDPRLTFEMDIQDVVMTLMPGLMLDLPGFGKLRRRADLAAADSRINYYKFETAVLQSALEFKRAYYRLYFLNEKIRVTARTLELARDLEQVARAQNEVGKVTLQDVLRAQIEEDRLKNEIANLEDSRQPLQAQLKAALGLRPEQPDPPAPAKFETTPLDLNGEQLLAFAFTRNPRLQAMAAEVRRAGASLSLAYRARVPDLSLGLEADAKADPTLFRPQFSVSLPIWRDKIAAEIAEAQAMKQAAESRLSAEQIALAVEFAEKSFMFREATRNVGLFQEALLPKARLSVEVARSGYLTGRIDFFNLIDAWRTLLEFESSEVEARTQRELVLAEISLLILGQPPEQAPFLGAAAAASQLPKPSTMKKSHEK